MMHNGTSCCYGSVDCVGFDLVWFSSLSSECLPIFGLHAAIHRVQKKGATDFFAVTFTNIDGFS